MQTIQIKTLDLRKLKASKRYRLYAIRDEDNVFYVGKSNDVISRLRGHRGRRLKPESLINEFIRANWPKSKEWAIDLYTLDDLPECASVDDAEKHLIVSLLPCLNIKDSQAPLPVPMGYKRTLMHPVVIQDDLNDAIDKLGY